MSFSAFCSLLNECKLNIAAIARREWECCHNNILQWARSQRAMDARGALLAMIMFVYSCDLTHAFCFCCWCFSLFYFSVFFKSYFLLFSLSNFALKSTAFSSKKPQNHKNVPAKREHIYAEIRIRWQQKSAHAKLHAIPTSDWQKPNTHTF